MESPIDERYRLLLLEHYLDNAVEAPFYGVIKKWVLVFVCPFCGSLGTSTSKKKHRKAALLWNATQHSWGNSDQAPLLAPLRSQSHS